MDAILVWAWASLSIDPQERANMCSLLRSLTAALVNTSVKTTRIPSLEYRGLPQGPQYNIYHATFFLTWGWLQFTSFSIPGGHWKLLSARHPDTLPTCLLYWVLYVHQIWGCLLRFRISYHFTKATPNRTMYYKPIWR